MINRIVFTSYYYGWWYKDHSQPIGKCHLKPTVQQPVAEGHLLLEDVSLISCVWSGSTEGCLCTWESWHVPMSFLSCTIVIIVNLGLFHSCLRKCSLISDLFQCHFYLTWAGPISIETSTLPHAYYN